MARIGRYLISEISYGRILSAARTRIIEMPHFFAWNFSHFAMKNKDRIQQFKGIHRGKRCFILANGPSLAKTNLDLLTNEYTFGLNRVYLNFAKSNFRPTYYVAMNELILEQFSADIAKLEMPKFLNWNRRSYYNLQDATIYYIKSKMVINDSFVDDVTKPIVTGGTVTFVALQIAYYMGFEKIFLIGLDHNYVERGEPSKTVVRQESRDDSHFHPDYFPKGFRWQLPDLLRSEIDFKLALSNYERQGREIFDATIGGKCTVFKKVEYFSLF
jgi:hypothetical protein